MMEPSARHSSAPRLHIELPRLQSAIRYYDDFGDQSHVISNPEQEDDWTIFFDGRRCVLDFKSFRTDVRLLMKHWCAFMLCSELAPATVRDRIAVLRNIGAQRIEELLSLKPDELKHYYRRFIVEYPGPYEIDAIRSLVRFLCSFSLCGWNPDLMFLVGQGPSPAVDKYAAVRAGDVFLTAEEEAAIVRHLDRFTQLVREQPTEVPDQRLEDMAMLVCSYQFGMRPKQIAMLRMGDVRVWQNEGDGSFSVHLTFMMIKQLSAERRLPMTRKVKREWAPLFYELLQRKRISGLAANERLFDVETPGEVGMIVMDATYSSSGCRRSCTELRHTAAQRLVDAGASQEELAAFMGHTDLTTGLVYFRASASQAEHVNKALGISETYNRVATIAHNRFISETELAQLKGAQQVGGVPHGIPIAGIGGCSSGQPACPYNPVMSCYGCSKFMPVRNAAIHTQVLADLRSVVQVFHKASRGDTSSPTYMQLRHTIASVQGVLDELRGNNDESLT